MLARRKKGTPVHGWVLLDKPIGITSTAAVAVVRRLFDAQKAGHAGTLDPLASGMLPIALGEATKTVAHIMDGEKIYQFTAAWGEERTTDDLEGEVTQTSLERPTLASITAAVKRFTGDIEQLPPQYSALKVEGRRAYDLARSGAVAELKPRTVRIRRIELLDTVSKDHADFRVYCGKGTYIRSLARDIGRDLGCLAHVSALRRCAVYPFAENGMISLETLRELSHKGAGPSALFEYLLPIETALDDIPALAVDGKEATRIRQGQVLDLDEARFTIQNVQGGAILITNNDQPVAIAELSGSVVKPKRMFNFSNSA